jgi:hypothetical protein
MRFMQSRRKGPLASKDRPERLGRHPQDRAGDLDDAAADGLAVARGGDGHHALVADRAALGGAAPAHHDQYREHAALREPDMLGRVPLPDHDRAAFQRHALEVRGEAPEVLGLERREEAVARGGVVRVHAWHFYSRLSNQHSRSASATDNIAPEKSVPSATCVVSCSVRERLYHKFVLAPCPANVHLGPRTFPSLVGAAPGAAAPGLSVSRKVTGRPCPALILIKPVRKDRCARDRV